MSIASIQIKSIEPLLKKRQQLAPSANALGLADCMVFYFTKQATFFSKKQQRITFTFFQGLNTNPQNLSLFLRDQLSALCKESKQKLTKGTFIIYNIFTKTDTVVQINIPGNSQIYQLHRGKKQLVSNAQIQQMYVSSVLRAMYGRNLVWGRAYLLFGMKGAYEEFKQFIGIFFKVLQKQDVYLSDDFEMRCAVKGSQACSIVYDYVTERRVAMQAIQILEKQIESRGGLEKMPPKILCLLAELYSSEQKHARSFKIIMSMLPRYHNDPYVLYYQAKYMHALVAYNQAFILVNNIIQYNQFQIWCLAASINTQLKNYSDALACLNHASKLAVRAARNRHVGMEGCYGGFEELGKKNVLSLRDGLECRPKLMVGSETPLGLESRVEQVHKGIVGNQFWRYGWGQKIVHGILCGIRYKFYTKKFQQLLESTFDIGKKEYLVVNFKAGMSQSMYIDDKQQQTQPNPQPEPELDQLPDFIQQQSLQVPPQQPTTRNNNLSVIQQMQSIIENSHFQEKQKATSIFRVLKHKKQLGQHFYKLIRNVLAQSQIEKAAFQNDYARLLKIYYQFDKKYRNNTYYARRLLDIFSANGEYRTALLFINETVRYYEDSGVRKVGVLPYWMHRYVFQVVQEKGLKYLLALGAKMELNEVVMGVVQGARGWKIAGCLL